MCAIIICQQTLNSLTVIYYHHNSWAKLYDMFHYNRYNNNNYNNINYYIGLGSYISVAYRSIILYDLDL